MKISDACKRIIRLQNRNYGRMPKQLRVTPVEWGEMMDELIRLKYLTEHEVVVYAFPIKLRNFLIMGVPVVPTKVLKGSAA